MRRSLPDRQRYHRIILFQRMGERRAIPLRVKLEHSSPRVAFIASENGPTTEFASA